MWGFRWLETLLQDLRFGIRMLRTEPRFTAIAVLTMSLGIGANSAIFSVVNGVLLLPMPFKDPDQLVKLWETFPPSGVGVVSVPNLHDWQEQNEVFEDLAAYQSTSYNLYGRDNPDRVAVATVTPNFFDTLGVLPRLGRSFLQWENQPGSHRVAILSDRLWRRAFGADTEILGNNISVNGENFAVVGVMPPGFQFPSESTALWVPLVFTAQDMANRGNHRFFVLGRIKSGVTLTQAQEQMDVIARGLEQSYPAQQTGRGIKLIHIKEDMVQNVRPALLVLSAAVGFVLLISCTNLANLLLFRAAARRREYAIRAALGAGRWRLIRQFLTESLTLSILGGAMGLLIFANWGLDLLMIVAESFLPRANEVTLDGRVIGFTLLLSLLTGLVFGLAPAVQVSKTDLQQILKGETLGSSSNRSWLRSILVVTEIAFALLLLISAGLMINSFLRLHQTESGLRPENVLTARVTLPASKYPDLPATLNFHQEFLNRVTSLPGVQAAGLINLLPLQQWGSNGGVEIEGQGPYSPGHVPLAEFRAISPDYFQAIGIPLLAGRSFTDQDRADGPPVVIINQTFARLYLPDEENLLGKRLRTIGDWRAVVGVVRDVKQRGLTRSVIPEIYIPYTQAKTSALTQTMSLVVYVTSSPMNLASAVREAVLAVDPAQPVYEMKTMEAVITGSVSDYRLNTILLSIFAAVALILAVIGIYGVMSYSVTQRTREIGIRMALGAQPRDIFMLIVRQGAILTVIGIAIGLACAFTLTRLMSSLLYGVGPTDPATFVVLSFILAAIAVLACCIPTRSAMRGDPIKAIRYE